MVGGQAGGMLAASGFGAQGKAALGGALGSLGLGGLNALIGRSDPDIPYQFMVEMSGIIQQVAFKKASGLKVSFTPKKLREGGNNLYEHSMVEPAKFEPLTLETGWYANNGDFYDWMRQLHDPGKPYKRIDIDIAAFNNKFSELCRYTLYGAFVTSYEGPTFDSVSKEIAFEKVTINYDYFDFSATSGLAKLGQDLLSTGMAGLSSAL